MLKSKQEKWINKQQYTKRWLMLGFCVWIEMGNYYNYDIPNALKNTFKQYFIGFLSETQFEMYYGLLYSITAFVNILTPFLGGGKQLNLQEMRDRLGNRITLIILLSIVSLGQYLFILGLQHFNLFYILIGRTLICTGMQPCGATQTSLLSQYFKYDHIAFATGAAELFATIGTITVLYLAPTIAQNYGLIIAVQSGTIANLISVCSCLITLIFDFDADSIEQHESIPQQTQGYSKLFFILLLYNALIFSSLLTFSNFSIGILSEIWLSDHVNPEQQAGEMMAIVWIVSSLLTPFFGFIIDKIGKRSIFNIIASFIGCIGLILVWYKYPLIAIHLIGISWSLGFASVWSSVVYLVDYQNLGIAYALMLSSYNLILTLLPLGVSVLRIQFFNYFYSLLLLSGLAFGALIVGIVMYYSDLQNTLDGKFKYDVLQQNDN